MAPPIVAAGQQCRPPEPVHGPAEEAQVLALGRQVVVRHREDAGRRGQVHGGVLVADPAGHLARADQWPPLGRLPSGGSSVDESPCGATDPDGLAMR